MSILEKLTQRVSRWLRLGRVVPPLVADLNDGQTSAWLAAQLGNQTPFLASRLGWEEAKAMADFSESPDWVEIIANRLWLHAGVFPPAREQLLIFCEEYQKSLAEIDLLAVMQSPFEAKLIRQFGKNPQTCELASLEPYFSREPWSQHLAGRRVLVIHPFADSIRSQYDQARDRLFKDARVLPKFELQLLKPPQTLGGNSDGFTSWSVALAHLKAQVSEREFDVAIVGCGAYGLPIGAFIKQMGRACIHLGGATQLLFGVSGARWRTQPTFQALMNDAWCPPLECERPPGWEKVEQGCYW